MLALYTKNSAATPLWGADFTLAKWLDFRQSSHWNVGAAYKLRPYDRLRVGMLPVLWTILV